MEKPAAAAAREVQSTLDATFGSAPPQSPGGSPRPAILTSPATFASPGGRGATVEWLPEEDAQLAELVAEGGPGSWEAKAVLFRSDRTGSSLRHRWKHLHPEDFGGSPLAGEPNSKGWSAAEDAELAGMVKAEGTGTWQDKSRRFSTGEATRH